MPTVIWLSDVTESDRARVGAKAANLAQVLSLGLDVRRSFCLTTEAYALFIQENSLAEVVERTLAKQQGPEQAAILLAAFRQGHLPSEVRQELTCAYDELGLTREVSVAVRSSATAEDLVGTSSAGQYATLLNLRGLAQVEAAVIECWASLWSPQAIAYRREQHLPQHPSMAILVQEMVAAEAAGVAFSRGPRPWTDYVIVEATRGLGEALVSGQVQPDRYVVARDTGEEVAVPAPGRQTPQAGSVHSDGQAGGAVQDALPGQRVLSTEQVRAIARVAMRLEGHFGAPQDVEWAWSGGQLSVLQSRPITAGNDSFFDTDSPEDGEIWTSAFLNERFPVPVSPLGWTLINELLEPLAFRDPLRYLGLAEANSVPITRLYHGHPYVSLFVFQTLYKVFPNQLLPEDACRYFPQGRTELRHEVQYPRSLIDPRFLWSMLWHLLPHMAVWSPWHNYRRWDQFATEHSRCYAELAQEASALLARDALASDLWVLIDRLQMLNRELLTIHRWTLTCTDLVYSLQRRLVRAWAKDTAAMEASTALVTGLPNRSAEMDRALHRLASLKEDGSTFEAELAAFFDSYGHRSLYLDIYHPPLSAQPAQVREWVRRIRQEAARAPVTSTDTSQEQERLRKSVQRGMLGRLKWWMLRKVIALTQHYMPLREDQRYAWQKALALQRELFLGVGARMARAGALAHAGHVFFLLKSEVASWVHSGDHRMSSYIALTREREFQRLTAQHLADPERSYPPFLKGNRPLSEHSVGANAMLRGHGVSPGIGIGRVVVLHSAAELGRVQAGDVLVAPGVDSAWTPVFGLLSALVIEHGGQLSHAAVIAREYGLPAVAGIESAASTLKDGEQVLVDGSLGVVERMGGPRST